MRSLFCWFVRSRSFLSLGIVVLLVGNCGPLAAQVNEWKAEAIIDLGDDVRTFTQTGGTSQNVTFTAESPLSGFSTVVDFENVVESDPLNKLLRARSSAKIDMPGFLDVKVLGKSKATFNDVLTVEPVQGWAQGLGIIEFVWALDGKLFTDTYSPDGSSLTFYTGSGNPNSVWDWAYYVEVEMRAKYLDAAQVEQNVDLFTEKVEYIGQNEQFSDAAKNFNEFIDRDDLRNVVFDQGITGVGDDFPIAEDGEVNVFVPAPAGTAIPVSFEMVAGLNVRFLNVDYGALKAEYSSAFDHTARLLGIRLFEADGTPYLGDAIIRSQSGAIYNVLPVPEAHSILLLSVGIAGLWAARRKAPSAA